MTLLSQTTTKKRSECNNVAHCTWYTRSRAWRALDGLWLRYIALKQEVGQFQCQPSQPDRLCWSLEGSTFCFFHRTNDLVERVASLPILLSAAGQTLLDSISVENTKRRDCIRLWPRDGSVCGRGRAIARRCQCLNADKRRCACPPHVHRLNCFLFH